MHQAILFSMHIPLTGVTTPILTTVFLQYLFDCFSSNFLEGHNPALSSEEMLVTSLHLDSITWEVSVHSKRSVSWSCFKYSNSFCLSSSSASLCFSAFFYTMVLATSLAFCITYSIWWASATFFPDRPKTSAPLHVTTASPNITV